MPSSPWVSQVHRSMSCSLLAHGPYGTNIPLGWSLVPIAVIPCPKGMSHWVWHVMGCQGSWNYNILLLLHHHHYATPLLPPPLPCYHYCHWPLKMLRLGICMGKSPLIIYHCSADSSGREGVLQIPGHKWSKNQCNTLCSNNQRYCFFWTRTGISKLLWHPMHTIVNGQVIQKSVQAPTHSTFSLLNTGSANIQI